RAPGTSGATASGPARPSAAASRRPASSAARSRSATSSCATGGASSRRSAPGRWRESGTPRRPIRRTSCTGRAATRVPSRRAPPPAALARSLTPSPRVVLAYPRAGDRRVVVRVRMDGGGFAGERETPLYGDVAAVSAGATGGEPAAPALLLGRDAGGHALLV